MMDCFATFGLQSLRAVKYVSDNINQYEYV